ncbi:hypothetical protein ATI61_105701 [Archangium gephyra]|uniref:ATP-grasp domain-containing protein n=1 Tax=Archangium gephyra TaxID=48 RepID=A0ABX9K3A6_9BACT|nr:hypothetical protein [Archangium gephyra]REG32373.1 hypothetical protein ATI61_105701 [Archangium gephyra]
MRPSSARDKLIASAPSDLHALALTVALARRGHTVFPWIADYFPTQQTSSFSIEMEAAPVLEMKGWDLGFSMNGINVVWYRKPQEPVGPSFVHPDDRVAVEGACKRYVQSFWVSAPESAVWVNSMEGKRRADSKMLQLREAVKCGLTIPTTLSSNGPAKIRLFVEQRAPQVIARPLYPAKWPTDNGDIRATFTSTITSDQLPDDRFIQACPCIYQEKVNKQFEVRVTFYWRVVDNRSLPMRQLALPDEVYKACRQLMARLGIVQGSFDFAVTEDGKWIFFEVNQSGQFLWLEDDLPDLPLLEITSQFLAAPSADFQWKPRPDPLRLSEIHACQHYTDLRARDKEILAAWQAESLASA